MPESAARPDPLDRVEIVQPAGRDLETALTARPAMPFDPAVTAFIEELGRGLRRDPAARAFPELVALGYWARRATVTRLAERFHAAYPEAVRMPRGLAFHIAPANVDTIFVYSLLLSMLAGNVNIVRVSARGRAQTDLLTGLLGRALESADPEIVRRTTVVRYPHDAAITGALSRRADLRIVWGGDATVDAVRQSPLAPTGTELVFPNRYSVVVLDAAAWLAAEDRADLARRLINDTLWFGQMACSSPRALIWRGSEADTVAASAALWQALDVAAVETGLELEPADAVAKLLAEQDMATVGGVAVIETPSNRVRAVRQNGLSGLGVAPTASAGFFVEHRIDALADLAPKVARDWQTVTSHGISATEWRAFLATERPHGIDRIVPLGEALDFDALWDGVDLVAAMTRMTVLGRVADITA